MAVDAALRLPEQTEPASAAGKPFLERRELGVINVGKTPGTRQRSTAEPSIWRRRTGCTCRWARRTWCSKSRGGGEAAKFYLVSTPAHARFEPVQISIDKAVPLAARRARDIERTHDLPVHRARDLPVGAVAARA